MKIRNGFVSNSSSSSFVLLIPKTDYEKVTKDMTPFEKEVLNQLKINEKITFMNTEMVLFEEITGRDEGEVANLKDIDKLKKLNQSFDEDDCDDTILDVKDKFRDKAKKYAFISEQDC